MALLQQPYADASTFNKDINYYLTGNPSSLNVNLITGSLSYSNDFATYSGGVITINTSGFYYVNLSSLIVSNYTFTGNAQIQLAIGSSLYVIQAGNSVAERNDFGTSDYVFYGSTGISRVASFVNLANTGWNLAGNFYIGSPKVYLTSGETISFRFISTISSTNSITIGLNGNIKIDKVSW